jgi:nitroreductase
MDHLPANPAEPIDEDRLRAYVALIDKLLLGARENANSGRMNSWNFGIRQDLD